MTIEHEFESRYEVIKWMLDRQLDRRSPNKKKRAYVIGRRYLVEKNENGVYDHSKSTTNKLGKNYQAGTSGKIADQLNITEKTVRNAAEFTQSVDRIVAVTGIKVNDLLDDQLARRNINDDTRAYLIGARYDEEKMSLGDIERINSAVPHNEALGKFRISKKMVGIENQSITLMD